MKKFKPTYLYIKQHSVTRKLYFGKTFSDPEKYQGSGIRWKNHIAYHGKQYIETLWYCLFYDEESIREFAKLFSIQQNIVESNNWLNLIPETGIDSGGGMQNKKHSEETKEKIRAKHLGKLASDEARKNMSGKGHKQSEETKEKIRKTLTGTKHTAERIAKIRQSKLGKHIIRSKITCPHCNKIGDISLLKRWHFNNCKLKNE